MTKFPFEPDPMLEEAAEIREIDLSDPVAAEKLNAELVQMRKEVEARNAEKARLAGMSRWQRAAELSHISRRKNSPGAFFQGNPCKRGHDGKRYVADGSCVVCTIESAKKSQEAKLQRMGVDVEGLKRAAIAEGAKLGFDMTTLEGQAAFEKATRRPAKLKAVLDEEEAAAREAKAEAREEKRERRRAEAEATRANPNSVRPPWERPV